MGLLLFCVSMETLASTQVHFMKKERDVCDGSKQRASSSETRMVGPRGMRRKLGFPFNFFCFVLFLGCLNLPTMQETWVEKIPWRRDGYSLQYSCLENSWTEEPSQLHSTGSQRVEHN